MQRRPGRTLLTLLGIVIGVAAAVAVWVSIRTARRAHRDMFEALTGRAALEVVAEGLGPFDPRKVAFLDRLADVKAAVPAFQTPAAVVGPGGAVPVVVLGIDLARDRAARDYVVCQGRGLRPGDGVMLEESFAAANSLAPGKTLRLLTTTGIAEIQVSGLLEPRGAAAFNGGAVAFLPLTTAQRLFRLGDQINSVQLVLAQDADTREVEDAVRRRLPAGLAVQVPSTRGALGQDLLMPSERGLASLSAASLMAGAFVIANAFLMNLGERRRQLAVLRALGVTRRQLTRLLLREALVLGLAGTILGIAVGMGLSLILCHVTAKLMGLTLPRLQWSWDPVLIAALVGPGMALAATILPARRAGRRAPLPDLLHQRGNPSEPFRRWPGYVGLALVPLIFALVLGVVEGWIPFAVALPLLAPGMALFLAGCALVTRLFLGPLARLVSALLGPALGTEGRLAFRQLDRHPGRTALTVGVLVIAVVFAVGFGQVFLNNLHDIHHWLDRVAAGDFFIRGSWPDVTTTVTTASLPENLAGDLAGMPGVERVDKFRYILVRAGGRPAIVMAYTYRADGRLPLVLAEGESESVRRGLLHGEVVLGTALGQRLGLGAGDRLTLGTRHGPKTLRVAGTATEYTGGGMAVYMEWAHAARLFGGRVVHAFMVTAHPGEAEGLEPALKRLCDRRHYLFQSRAGLRLKFDRQSDGFVGFVWALIALVFVVASLGIVNTLAMNVLEQTRELGTLRAIGMRRRQVGKMVLSQGLILALTSLVPGVAGGVFLAYLINVSIYPLTGQRVPFQVEPVLIAGCFLAALAIALLAAFIQARRAARLRVIEALQYE
jgi:putative ABC transport system permease protein